jgi:hypothetical protein
LCSTTNGGEILNIKNKSGKVNTITEYEYTYNTKLGARGSSS